MKPHKKKHHRHHEIPFDPQAFMRQVEAEMERDELFANQFPQRAVKDLIEIGESVFTFIRLSNLGSRTKKAFWHLEKQFLACGDMVR